MQDVIVLTLVLRPVEFKPVYPAGLRVPTRNWKLWRAKSRKVGASRLVETPPPFMLTVSLYYRIRFPQDVPHTDATGGSSRPDP